MTLGEFAMVSQPIRLKQANRYYWTWETSWGWAVPFFERGGYFCNTLYQTGEIYSQTNRVEYHPTYIMGERKYFYKEAE